MRYDFFIIINRIIMRAISWYISKDVSYSKVYSLNCELKRLSIDPVPGTWLELDWISKHPWVKYQDFEEEHYLNSFRRQGLINEITEIERKNVEGDFLELGVFKGFSAYIMLEKGKSDRCYVGFDTFLGLSEPIPGIDGSHWSKGSLAFSEQGVLTNLGIYRDRITLIKGQIPQVFLSNPLWGRKFALVHIDLDLYEPTRNALEFGWEKLSNGGSLICDDYGFSTCPGATKAVNEFLENHPDVQISVLAVGGIVVRKHGI
jgi:hypothetical protein